MDRTGGDQWKGRDSAPGNGSDSDNVRASTSAPMTRPMANNGNQGREWSTSSAPQFQEQNAQAPGASAKYIAPAKLLAPPPSVLVWQAVADNDVEAVRWWIESTRVAPGSPDTHGNTAVHVAAHHGRVDILRILLESGGSPDFPDAAGNTPLHLAAHFNHPAAVALLLETHAVPTLRNSFGATPLDDTPDDAEQVHTLLLAAMENEIVTHYLEDVDNRRKRYEFVRLTLVNTVLTVAQGAIGTAGKVRIVTYKSIDRAYAALDKRLEGLMARGWSEARMGARLYRHTVNKAKVARSDRHIAAYQRQRAAIEAGMLIVGEPPLPTEVGGVDWAPFESETSGSVPFFSEAFVESLAASPQYMARARKVVASAAMHPRYRRGPMLSALCTGSRNETYSVRVRFDPNEVDPTGRLVAITHANCNCMSASTDMPGRCKHILALLLHWLDDPSETSFVVPAYQALPTKFFERLFGVFLSNDDATTAAAAQVCSVWRTMVARFGTGRWHSAVFTPPPEGGRGGLIIARAASAVSFSGLQPYTIETWLRPRTKSSSGTLVAKVDRGVGAEYALELHDSVLRVFRNIEPYVLDGTTTLAVNRWYHVAVTFNQMWVRLYLNGEEEAAMSWGPHNAATGIPLCIGGVLDAGVPASFFDGDVQEVRIWAASLPQARIKQSMFASPGSVVAAAVAGGSSAPRLVSRIRVSAAADAVVDDANGVSDLELMGADECVAIARAGFHAFFGLAQRAAAMAERARRAEAGKSKGADDAGASSSGSHKAVTTGDGDADVVLHNAMREPWYIFPDEVTFGELLGSGAFGAVHAGEWRAAPVAIKKLLDAEMGGKERLETFRREISIVARLRGSPYVVQFLGACMHPTAHFIVTELMSNKSVEYWIRSPDKVLSVPERVRMGLDAARGMLHIHAEGLIHGDLALRNLLVDDTFRVKVTDFGLSRVRTGSLNEVSQAMGTPVTMAPELIQGHAISTKVDVYSFGVVLWQLYTRDDPFPGLTPMQVAWRVVMQGERPEIPAHTPSSLTQLIERCWAASADDRPDFTVIVRELSLIAVQPL
ncbi:TKL protein kinase [Thecamonas trahens ATCC 50062]|uniref:TKL protein kinase n=1 Tax=Thecamonas trahens ATCC 50062 TaxID=461836 RepID=A0A0L0DDM3_THETB|nr:TKL protein kinase [Thecamonas trahens ATCC 50062]KNC50320.1 TKL protein kinase [Thecamonas trahens ATCC 50062]|eukprot:XP_013756866.1 TKL protein kinase [Thecamonas trahens ATCC 50062]